MGLKNRKKVIIYLTVLFITAVSMFVAGVFSAAVWNYFHPKYAIEFNKDAVDIQNILRFNRVKNILLSQYYEPVDENKLLEGSIHGMAKALRDPYTTYYTPEEMQLFIEHSSGSYVGIGVTVYMDENNILTVSEIFPDSPAKKAGMKKGDRIIKVDDEDVSSIGDSDIIIQKIKGEPDTHVLITVFRPSINNTIDIDIVREKIVLKYVESKMLHDGIGYLRIKMFDEDISDEFRKHLGSLMAQGMKGLVLDLRDNPGGDYDQVAKIADIILPKGIIVYMKDRYGNKKDEKFSDQKELGIPLAVLINGYSASASEILCAAIKDYKKGVLVGTTTFGKGIVQQIHPLEGGAGLKLTIARYFTPSGVCIQGIGVTPDVEVKLDDKYKYYSINDIPPENDKQLQTAVKIVFDKIKNTK